MVLHLGRHVAPWTLRFAVGLTQRRSYTSGLLNTLEQRGFIQQVTREQEFNNTLNSSSQVVYTGIDPTASSLHIGHLLPFMCLLHFQLHGHTAIPLIGGATGLIGDPSGRKTERDLADVKQVEDNVTKLTRNVKHFFARAAAFAADRKASNTTVPAELEVKSNLSWHRDFNMLQFLQKVGVHVRVNSMLNRESVRARLDSKQGISFTEFTYQLLQAYDFHYLHRNLSCTIQVGGSDQWGNITAGLELIGRLDAVDGVVGSPPAFGLTTPLLTTSTGEKFGKSAGNAVWLDPDMTSVFDFYQYFLKVEDADVEKYLKLFTLLPLPEIQEVVEAHKREPEKRTAQRRLAAEVTELVHQKHGVEQAERITYNLFKKPDAASPHLDSQSLIEGFQGDPRLITCELTDLTSIPVMKLASKHGLVASTSAARQLIQARGLYVNDKTVPEIHFTLSSDDLIEGRIAIIRAGKDKLVVLAANAA